MDISGATQEKEDRIVWAKHNKDACQHLSKEICYPDWMVTTAFYSAIHYVDSKLFPLPVTTNERKENEFVSLDDFYLYTKRYNSDMPPKHDFRIELVYTYFPKEIYKLFNRLKTASNTARYTDYKLYDFAKAQTFYLDLCKIQEYCTS